MPYMYFPSLVYHTQFLLLQVFNNPVDTASQLWNQNRKLSAILFCLHSNTATTARVVVFDNNVLSVVYGAILLLISALSVATNSFSSAYKTVKSFMQLYLVTKMCKFKSVRWFLLQILEVLT
jgi:hypothetical protein